MAIPQDLQTHFAPYIRELRELFAMHGVGFGAAGDLPAFAARLDGPGAFAEDVSSILRSIILREGGAVPDSELLELLALAVAGPGVNPAAPETQPAFRRLLAFVGSVARRPWNVPPGGGAAGDAGSGATPKQAATRVGAPPNAAPSGTAPVAYTGPGSSAKNGWAKNGSAAASPAPAPELTGYTPRFSARFTNRPDPETQTQTQTQTETEIQTEGDEPAQDALPAPSPPPRFSSSAPLWVGAALAIALVLLVALYSRWSYAGADQRPAPSESITLPEPTPAAAPAVEPEPKPPAAIAEETTPPPPPAVKPAAPPARSNGTSASFAMRAAPAPKPAAPAPAPSPVSEPTPAAMLAAAAPELAAEGADSSSPADAEARSMLRSPAGRAGKGPYFLVSSGIMASHLLEAPEPGYPMVARLTHIGGQVIMQAVISTEGLVIATRVLSGHRLLRGAAVAAVKKWRYRPYVLDGHPVNVATIITVEFHPHE